VKCIRIVIADRQARIRFALAVLLGQQQGLAVVGEVADADSLLHKTRELQPDLVLLHWRLPGCDMAGLLPALRAICPDLHVVVLSARPEMRQAALEAGADAFVSKIDPPERLLAVVRCVSRAHNEPVALPVGSNRAQGDPGLEKRQRVPTLGGGTGLKPQIGWEPPV
jgi:DNA-binding NarL/FixJ family response regulator